MGNYYDEQPGHGRTRKYGRIMSKNKIKRNNQKRINKDKKLAEKEMEQKLNMFDKIDDECLNCQITFDKKDRSMVESWRVVVREKEGKVNLYCPDCWKLAQKIVAEVLGGQEDTKSNV